MRRSFSLATALTMLLLVLSCGQASKELQLNEILKTAYLPSDSYYLSEEYLAPHPKKAIILISEPHVDAFSQRKLLGFLDSLHAHDPRGNFNLYCVEGAAGVFDVKEQRKLYEKSSAKFDVALSEGFISGWELELLKNREIKAVGIEDPFVYQMQVNLFGDFYKDIDERLYQRFMEMAGQRIIDVEKILVQIHNKAISAIIEGAEKDVMSGGFANEAIFKAKYNRFLRPLIHSDNSGLVEEALSGVWAMNALKVFEKANNEEAQLLPFIQEAFPDSLGLQDDVRKMDSLDEVARKRSEIMGENTFKALDKDGPTAVVFIGSGHKSGLTNLFKKNEVSYLYFDHLSNHTDMDLYMDRLKGGSDFLKKSTMPPSCLNPIEYPELKDDFIYYINNLGEDKIREVADAQNKSFMDKVALANPDNMIKTPISVGASGDAVFDVKFNDIHESAIVKVYRDGDKAVREKLNAEAMNGIAREAGIAKLYPEYYKITDDHREIWQEKIESLTYKQFLEQESISQATKEKYVYKYLDLTDIMDDLYRKATETEGKVILDDKVPSAADLKSAIATKVQSSKLLNAKLYTEAGNSKKLDDYYSRLDRLLGHLMEGVDIKKGVSVDYNMNNLFIDGRAIDPTDDCFSSAVKSKALKLKEAANYLLDFTGADKAAKNTAVIHSLIERTFPGGITESNYKELIIHIYLYDFSDAKKIMADEKYLDVLTAYNKVGVSDKEKYACMTQVPGFFFNDRAKKNLLLIELLKDYNQRFKKGLDTDILPLQDYHAAGLDVFNIYPFLTERNENLV